MTVDIDKQWYLRKARDLTERIYERHEHDNLDTAVLYYAIATGSVHGYIAWMRQEFSFMNLSWLEQRAAKKMNSYEAMARLYLELLEKLTPQIQQIRTEAARGLMQDNNSHALHKSPEETVDEVIRLILTNLGKS